eukprot:scaffold8357_cov296-Pinguiococcus_pyrenoidosus.AAC.1
MAEIAADGGRMIPVVSSGRAGHFVLLGKLSSGAAALPSRSLDAAAHRAATARGFSDLTTRSLPGRRAASAMGNGGRSLVD